MKDSGLSVIEDGVVREGQYQDLLDLRLSLSPAYRKSEVEPK